MVNDFIVYIKKRPLQIIRHSILFFVGFFFFFMINEFFIGRIIQDINTLYEMISGVTLPILPIIWSMSFSLVFYTISLVLFLLLLNGSIFFEIKKGLKEYATFSKVIGIVSLILGIFIALILHTLPFFTTFFVSTLILYTFFSFSKLIASSFDSYFHFLQKYFKLAFVSVLAYIFFTLAHFVLSISLLQQLGQNPYSVWQASLFLIGLRWLYHIIVFHYIIHASFYVLSLSLKSSYSLKESLRYSFKRKDSYVISFAFSLYLMIIYILGYVLLYIPDVFQSTINFIFFSITLPLGIIVVYTYGWFVNKRNTHNEN